MRVDLRYYGASGVREVAGGEALAFAPNLAREKVFFDGALKHSLRYREAMSALHDVVVGDLRFKAKDKSAYLAWKAEKLKEEQDLKRALRDQEVQKELAKLSKEPIPSSLEEDFQRMHRLYWTQRRRWAAELSRNDPDLFRALVPCDPVVTVAPDVVFFECFAKDESAYGCLMVDRDAFDSKSSGAAALGTTNVDYSLALYDHFQSLRTYRSTRLLVDPSGFEVKTEGNPDIREEKIDLPPSWLRGFGQLQAATLLPHRRASLSVDVVYSILAYLKRHREKTGPRSIRFHLTPGKPVRVTLDPWGVELLSRGRPYEGAKEEVVKVWGRRRLMSLARTLPLAESFDVLLLGTGLPSIWCANMAEMRFILALSGWTANDWTSGTSLDQHFPQAAVDERAVDAITKVLAVERRANPRELAAKVAFSDAVIASALFALAKRGQLVFDFANGVHRWRPILPVALSEAIIGPEPEEIREGKKLATPASVKIERREPLQGGTLFSGLVDGVKCEAIVDADGAIAKAKCGCSHYFKSGLRKGPCRHLFALRAVGAPLGATTQAPAIGHQVAGARRSIAIRLRTATIAALEAVAKRRSGSMADVVELAWRVGRAEVAAISDAPGGGAGDRTSETLAIDARVLEEMQAEAARLDISVGAVFELCFERVKDTLELTSNVLKGS